MQIIKMILILASLSMHAAAKEPTSIQSSLSLETVQSLHQNSDPGKLSQNQLRMSFTKTFTPFALSSSTGLSQDTREGGSTRLSDTQVGLSVNSYKLGENLTWAPAVQLTLPTSESSSRDQGLDFALASSQPFTYISTVLSKKLQWTLSPSLHKNFHAYTLDALGSPNIEYLISFSGRVAVEPHPGLSLLSSYTALRGYTYRGFERDLYQFVLGASYALSSRLSASTTLATGGAAFQPNGVSSNIKFFDENATTVTGGITYVF